MYCIIFVTYNTYLVFLLVSRLEPVVVPRAWFGFISSLRKPGGTNPNKSHEYILLYRYI